LTCERFRQRARLAREAAADDADGVRVIRGFDPHDVLHHVGRNGEVLAVR
jgi:hypothetical protein